MLVGFPSEAIQSRTFVCREFFKFTNSISLVVISLFKWSFLLDSVLAGYMFLKTCPFLLCCFSVTKCVWLFATPWTEAYQAPLSFTISSNSRPLSPWCHLTVSSPATLFSFSFSLSQHQGLFQWVTSGDIRLFTSCVPKYWGFSHQSFQWIFSIDFL